MDLTFLPFDLVNDFELAPFLAVKKEEPKNKKNKNIHGQYSPKSKQRAISRYIKKRSLRNFTRKIRYSSRKKFADTRERQNGRFTKKCADNLC
jgi:hypothetical protein